jgi:hypothetical protein
MTDSSNTDNPGVNKIGPQAFPGSSMCEYEGPMYELVGANPGRDQDRSREDECQGSTYR